MELTIQACPLLGGWLSFFRSVPLYSQPHKDGIYLSHLLLEYLLICQSWIGHTQVCLMIHPS